MFAVAVAPFCLVHCSVYTQNAVTMPVVVFLLNFYFYQQRLLATAIAAGWYCPQQFCHLSYFLACWKKIPTFFHCRCRHCSTGLPCLQFSDSPLPSLHCSCWMPTTIRLFFNWLLLLVMMLLVDYSLLKHPPPKLAIQSYSTLALCQTWCQNCPFLFSRQLCCCPHVDGLGLFFCFFVVFVRFMKLSPPHLIFTTDLALRCCCQNVFFTVVSEYLVAVSPGSFWSLLSPRFLVAAAVCQTDNSNAAYLQRNK